MKQLCTTNDTVTQPKAIPRTLNVVASRSSACSRSWSGVSTRYYEEAGTPTFTESDRTGRCPSLIASEKTGGITGKITHDEQLAYTINTRRHKPRMFIDIF